MKPVFNKVHVLSFLTQKPGHIFLSVKLTKIFGSTIPLNAYEQLFLKLFLFSICLTGYTKYQEELAVNTG